MKLSIITRALNRLEYTTRCVAAVAKGTGTADHEHIIVNQNSSDGTREWCDWIAEHGGPPFSRVRAIHLDKNTGDWGGMLVGAEQATGKYIVQLDNDIEVPPYWDFVLLDALEQTNHGAAVLSIRGCGENPMPAKPSGKILHAKERELEIGTLREVTACWMARMDTFRELNAERRMRNCREFTKRVPGGPCRVFGVYATEMDGSDEGNGSPDQRAKFLQQRKYPKTDSQIWEKLS